MNNPFPIDNCLICGKALVSESFQGKSGTLLKCPDINFGLYESEYAVEIGEAISQHLLLHKYTLATYITSNANEPHYTYVDNLTVDLCNLLQMPAIIIDHKTDLNKLKNKIDFLISIS